MTLKGAWDLPDRMWLDHGGTEVDLSGLSPQDQEQERFRIRRPVIDNLARWWQVREEIWEGLLSV